MIEVLVMALKLILSLGLIALALRTYERWHETVLKRHRLTLFMFLITTALALGATLSCTNVVSLVPVDLQLNWHSRDG